MLVVPPPTVRNTFGVSWQADKCGSRRASGGERLRSRNRGTGTDGSLGSG
jgi:hypothetical protein